MREEDSGKLAWFFAGAAIGAAIALLYAPAPGRDTRRKIGQTASKGKERLAEKSRDLVEKGKELYERGRQMAEDASEVIESGRKLVKG
ncbi:MAG: YtxH domain-containing protein [Candidatus Solibacter usitatus]|nr:YtxH domain-containing protein [Candidatus Solibacter usitatus]